MAFPTLTPEELKAIQDKQKEIPIFKQAADHIRDIPKKVYSKTPSILDGMVLLTISFWYFFFTGLAVLFNRKLPKEWLAIGKDLNKGRIARKINPEKTKEAGLIQEKPQFKVVDLETNRPIPVPTV